MKLLTKEIQERLKKEAPLYSKDGKGKNAEVICRLYIPDVAEYLVTEGEEQPDGDWLLFSYGKIHFWEWGYISLNEVENIRLPDGTGFICEEYHNKTVQEVYDEIQEKRQREDRSDEEEER